MKLPSPHVRRSAICAHATTHDKTRSLVLMVFAATATTNRILCSDHKKRYFKNSYEAQRR
eukprot:m.1024727 g.1024727  ORF g.1024727 m.1024727 type:complete len:60 (-) comp24099_c3_seq4:2230-2409(-)